MTKKILFLVLVALLVFFGWKLSAKEEEVVNNPTAILETSLGTIVCELFPNEAPETVANFVGLATGEKAWTDPRTGKPGEGPYYDGTLFHRVIPKFMVQGGDPTGTGRGGPGYQFKDEFSPKLRFDKPGKLAMANSGPGTNGSQFFITVAPTTWLNDKHTIFGKVIAGQDVVDKMTTVERGPGDRPVTDIVLKKITISTAAD